MSNQPTPGQLWLATGYDSIISQCCRYLYSKTRIIADPDDIASILVDHCDEIVGEPEHHKRLAWVATRYKWQRLNGNRRKATSLSYAEGDIDPMDVDASLEEGELTEPTQLLNSALRRLPMDDDRQLIADWLRFDLNNSKMAEALEVSETQVRMKVLKALSKLRWLIEQEQPGTIPEDLLGRLVRG